MVSFGLVEAFGRWLLARGYTIKSVNDYLGVVKTYAALAQQAGLMDAETLLAIGRIPRLYGQRATNVDKERTGKKQATRRGYKKPEAVYDLARRLLYVERYKTGTKQHLEMPDALVDALVLYLNMRRDWPPYQKNPGKQTDAPLRQAEAEAIAKTGHGVWKAQLPASVDWSTQQLWEQVRKVSLAAGIEPLSPYDGRHQWTYDEVMSGTPHPIIMQAGGWKAGALLRLARGGE